MAGNKRRTGRPGGMTGTAPARVPARHNTAERRRTQSGKRQAVSGNVRQEGNRQVSEGQKQAAQRPRPAAGQRQAAADRRPDLGYPAAGNRKKARPAQSYESRDARAYQPQNPPKKKKVRRFYDLTLVLIVVALTVFGLVMIYSASSYTAQISEETTARILCAARALLRQAALCLCCSYPRWIITGFIGWQCPPMRCPMC